MAERPPTWREVRLGAAIVAVLAIVLGAIWIQRGRNPFVDSYTLELLVENAKGLQEGAPVTLSGLTVGEVLRIDVLSLAETVREPRGGRMRSMNIRIVLSVDERYKEEITERSRARISTQGVSGARYVRIEKGSVGGAPLPSGSRLAVAPSLDVEQFLTGAAEVVNRIGELNRNADELREKMKFGKGTLGRFMANPSDNEVAENFEEMNAAAARVVRALHEGPGTFALERRTGRVRANLERFEKSVLEIQHSVLQGEGSFGRFARDTTLQRGLERLQRKAETLTARFDSGEGSLGRFVNDPELLDQLQLLTQELDSLAAQVKDDPLGSVDIDLK